MVHYRIIVLFKSKRLRPRQRHTVTLFRGGGRRRLRRVRRPSPPPRSKRAFKVCREKKHIRRADVRACADSVVVAGVAQVMHGGGGGHVYYYYSVFYVADR